MTDIYQFPTFGRVVFRQPSETVIDGIVQRSVGDIALRHALMAECLRRESGAHVRDVSGWRDAAEAAPADYAGGLRILRRLLLSTRGRVI